MKTHYYQLQKVLQRMLDESTTSRLDPMTLLAAREALNGNTNLWPLDAAVEKISGSSWRGRVVGYYSTALTPIGYCVESFYEPGAVQVYSEKALRRMP